jgi:alpha-1,2-mannosyltransferase
VRLGAALARLLPVFAIVVFAASTATTLAVAGDTLGYDFRAYHSAATRLLAGQPPYDTTYTASGGFGLFYYPPTFLLLAVPVGFLPVGPATWAWIGLLLGAFGAGVALMPVRPTTRWLIVLLAGLSWPFVYNVKLGQVGPLLFLLFAVGWRGLERPAWLGLSGALGAAIKIQPGLILAWALLTRRWAAVAVGVVTLIVLTAASALVAGVPAWTDFVAIIRQVSDPIGTPHNFTPGAVLYQAGAGREVATAVQWAVTAAVLVVVVFAALRRGPVPSYFVAVVATQLLSPILWDHYAMLLLLPVAWLLDRGHRWAVLVPLATPVFLVGIVPAVVYPMAFAVTLVALLVVDGQEREAR